MEIEIAPTNHLNIEPVHPGESDIISQVSDQQNNSVGRMIRKQSITGINVSKSRQWFYACMKSRKMHGLCIVLFTILSITVGVLIICLTSPSSSKTCQRVFQNEMKSSLVSSSQPQSLALGYFNDDHEIDIVVVNSGNDTIGILLSKGNGTFAKQYTYSTGIGSRPSSVAVNDFNNDNYSDIIVANYGTNNIGIFLGNGNGTFNEQKIFTLDSSRPLFITSGDFNKDNRMDIVVINYGTNTIGILLGYGNGSFQNQTTYSTGYDSFPSSLVVADFNNDSYLDIVVANRGTYNIGIFLGYDNGTFASQHLYTTLLKSNPSSIAIGDINNDQKLDIVVANNGTGSIGIFFGAENGTFQSQITFQIDVKSYPQYIAIGDLNIDNELDLIVVDSQHDQVHVLPGNGNGSFTTITTYDGISGSHPLYVAVTDLNSNNRSDIIVVNYGTSNVLVLTDYSFALSARQINYDAGSSASIVSVAVSDFNSDQNIDVVYLTSDFIHVRTGLGDGTLNNEIRHPLADTNNPQYICVGDINNDTKMDIVGAFDDSDSIGILLGNGDGTFAEMLIQLTDDGFSPWWIALGDIDNDGRLDIVSANTGSNTVGIHLGNGDGTFGTMVSYYTDPGTNPQSVAIGDLDHDNNLDLVVASNNALIVVFLGNGHGYFSIWQTLPTYQNSFCFSIALADFDGNTYLDIVVANTNTNNIGVFLGYENTNFGSQTSYPTGSASQPYYVFTADFNNDNVSDIVTTNLGSDEVVMFYGVGDGTFQLDRKYSTGFGSKPYGIVAADLDNDKQLNIIVALSGNRRIAILSEHKAAVFVNETKYSTGSAPQPYSVAIGDFNNDNQSDIVVANSGTDNLGILLALGNATFNETMKYDIGTDFYPQYVITCDVNNDDQLDIVSVNSKTESISILRGYGNGRFAEQLIYSTGNDSHPVAVAAGDFNNDTRLDLVIANERTDSIGIFYGFNYTVFENQKVYSIDNSLKPSAIGVSDFNNDSYLDIATTFDSSSKIGILLGNGNGSFTTYMMYSTGSNSRPLGIAVDDFNNDSRSDIVVANYGKNNIGIFLGYGNGGFTNMKAYSTGESSGPLAVTVGDVNNDNRLDIVVANGASNSIGVLLGVGNGSFLNVTTYSTGAGSACSSVTLGDFNNDDNLDIAVSNFDTRNVGIFFGYDNGFFRDQIILTIDPTSRPIWLTVGDFNSDSRLDIAVADWNNDLIGIFIGHGNGTFDTMRTYSSGDGSSPRYVTVGDFNNDNILDIAVANYGTSSIVVLFGLGNGRFLLGTPHSTGYASQPYALAIGNFNNDSRLDIVVANYAANNIGVFLAYDNQPFGSIMSLFSYEDSKPHSVVVNDLNNDGHLDIVIVNYGTNDLHIVLGYGNGYFERIWRHRMGNGSAPSSVAIAHFNNDTYLDIVVTNSQTDNIVILLGYGNAVFVTGKNYSTGIYSSPYSVTTGDFNNDNKTDIAVANSGTSNILLFYGYGNGTFGNEISYFLGYNYRPYSIAVAYLNEDNWLDIIIACYGTDHVETLIKLCL